MMWMLRNSKGKKDSMLSFAVVGLLISSVSVILSFVEKISVAGFELTTRPPDVALITVFLGATLIAYVTRRNTKDKYDARKEELMLRAKYGFPADDLPLLTEKEK